MPGPTLIVLDGPPIEPIHLIGAKPLTVGRHSACDRCLPDPAVSREHAILAPVGETWTIADAHSRHGVHLNGVRLDPDTPTPLVPGARVRIGPWTFRFREDGGETTTMHSIDDTRADPTRVSRVELGDLAQRRLELLIRWAHEIQTAPDEASIARAVTEALTAGAGFERAAVIRTLHGCDEIELLAVSSVSDQPAPVRPSRTLLRAASEGQIVLLEDTLPAQRAVSIVAAGVSSALCAPVRVGDAIDAYLYLDGTGATPIQPDAPTFCAAIADLCGLAFSSLRRRNLQIQQERLLRDLDTARLVQQRLMPPRSGSAGPISYTLHFQPGRIVAGDLFGVRRLGEDTAAVFIGDVTGKGLGASLLMATIQARLETLLEIGGPLTEIVNRLSGYVAQRSTSEEFATLFVGVINARERTLACVDAGHGYVAICRAGDAEIPTFGGGPPIGVDADIAYEQATIPLPPDGRVVLLSDGVPEQPDPRGAHFGVERIVDRLRATDTPEKDVAALLAALTDHAGSHPFGDDVTIASVAMV